MNQRGLMVDIGVQQPALMRQKEFAPSQRLTIQVINLGEKVEVQPVNRGEVPQYWGYRVKVEKRPFGQLINDPAFDLRIATARIGDSFQDVKDKIAPKWTGAERVLVAFGRRLVVCMKSSRTRV